MNRHTARRLATVLCATGLLGNASQALASAFQLWEQDAASVANYHAGYAALATDASTSFYNPAGITRIKNQQVVLGVDAVMTDLKFRGTINNPLLGIPAQPMQTTAQGGTFSLVPDLHYVAPISDRVGFGFSVDIPFGLKTNYGISTPVRYTNTQTSIRIIDYSPALGIQITDQGSVGFGFDVQRAFAEIDSVASLGSPLFDTPYTNRATDTAYGYHLGGLYQFTPCTRAGMSYHSQVVHHLSGSSKLIGVLPNAIIGGPVIASRATANLTLPPYTALSIYHKPNSRVAVMGSVIYTQWTTFKNLILNNAAGFVGFAPSTSVQLIIPENYRNTWNASIGADYYPNDQFILRGGVGYDETPLNNTNRNLQLPDNNRYVIALGGHYQATKTIGFDLGWTHLFIAQARVNPAPSPSPSLVVTTDGNANGGANVIGGQVTWDIT